MNNKKDYSHLIGEKFGRLLITGVCSIGVNRRKIHGFICKCDCGNSHTVRVYGVLAGTTKSCGCLYRLQLVGKKFGKLKVVERVIQGVNQNLFRCICECGKERIAIASELNRGSIVSCGCYSRAETKKVKYMHPKLYDVWKGMKARCSNVNNSSYKNYGAKGVKVCEEWVHDFKAFFNWCINNGYESGLELDKDIISNRKGLKPNLYSPDRCMFVTSEINAQNRSVNKITMDIANEIRLSNLKRVELSKKYQLNPCTIDRIKQNKIWKVN